MNIQEFFEKTLNRDFPKNGISHDREKRGKLLQSLKSIEKHPVICALLENLGGFLLILNSKRQIIAANHGVLKTLDVEDPESLVGCRPGEAFGCKHAKERIEGCGAGTACESCGAFIAIAGCQESGDIVEQECLITICHGDKEIPMEFLARAMPMNVDDECMIVVTLQDISSQKRKEALEKVFFHDILNTIQGLSGWSELLPQLDAKQNTQATEKISILVNQLRDEIMQQRDLSLLESDELEVENEEISLLSILERLRSIFEKHLSAREKIFEINQTKEAVFVSNETILMRILTNMVKNAFEATPENGTVKLDVSTTANEIEFTVWNSAFITPDIAGRIFQRSFSTKSQTGRGLGTYSIKLFGEKCLGGKIDFQTSENHGTNFTFTLPLKTNMARTAAG